MRSNSVPPALAIVAIVLLAGCVAGGADSIEGTDEPAGDSQVRGRPADNRELPSHITGVIIDTELIPIADADIAVTPGDHLVLTDVEGTFVVGPLDPGTYTVMASKRGYAAKEQQITVTADDESKVRLTLEAVASDVPYHETFSESMYLICHVVAPNPLTLAQSYILNAPCAGIVDLFTGAVNTLDHWMFSFTIDKPGFTSLVMEMVWDSQQLGHDGLMQLTTLGTAEVQPSGGVGVGGTVYGGEMGEPFYMLIHAGQNYWDPEDPESVFYPTANETEHFQMLIAGGAGNNTAPNTAFFIEFRPTAYLTFFYNRQAQDGFSILPPE